MSTSCKPCSFTHPRHRDRAGVGGVGVMRADLFVYLSGPITAKHGYSVEENVAAAVKVFVRCLQLGIPAFCPQLTGAFPSAHSDVPYEAWMAYDFAVIDRCTHVCMLPRWQQSAGAVRELEYARAAGMPIFLSPDDLFSFITQVPA